MKRLFLMTLIACTSFFVACEYDDSEVMDRLENVEDRVTKLEELCAQMNTNISSLQAIVNALQQNEYITAITPITKDGVEVGYTITFTSGKNITIYHGKDGVDGEDGRDGSTPVIGVKKDSDNVYYWTINGEWLTDANGNKIQAEATNGEDGKDGNDGKDGKDGVTPKLKIVDDYWYISYDDGKTWTKLDKATGEDGQDGQDGTNGTYGDSIFQNVSQDDDYVYFTLNDGNVITIPKVKSLDIVFNTNEAIFIDAGESYEVTYNIIGADANTKVAAMAQDNYKVMVEPTDYKSGKIIVTAPSADITKSQALVFVNKGTQTIMRALYFTDTILTVSTSNVQLKSGTTDFTVKVTTNLDYTVYIPDDAKSWVTQVTTRGTVREDILSFTVTENNSSRPRSTIIYLRDADGKTLQSIAISQDSADPTIEISKAELSFSCEEGSESIDVTSNSDWKIEVPADATWVSVSPASGNGNGSVKVSVAANTTSSARSAEVKFIALHYISGDFANMVLAINQEANEQATEPEVIFSDNFDKIVAEKDENGYWPYLDAKYMNPQGSAAEGVTYSTSEGNITLRANSTSNGDYSDYEGSGSNNIFFGRTPNKFVIENIALPADKDCYVLTFGSEMYDTNNKEAVYDLTQFHVYISGDNTKWSELSYAFAEGDNLNGRWNDATASFKLTAVPEKLYIKFVADAASSYRLDDVTLTTGGEGAQTIDLAQGTEEETPGQGGDNEGEEDTNASTIKIDFTVAANYPAGFPVASANKIVDRTEYTFGGYKFALAGSTGAGFYQVSTSTETYLLFGKLGAYVELPAVEGKSLKKVVATARKGTSGSVMVGVRDAAGTDVDGGAPIKWEQVAPYTYTYELNGTTVNTSYYLYINSAHNAQLTSLELHYSDGNNDNTGEGGGEDVTPEVKEMTIAEAIAAEKDTAFKLKESTVVAVSKKGLMLYDGANYIYAYAGSQPEVTVGDKVIVEGTKGTYSNMPQVSNPVITKTGTNSSFAHPTAVEMDGAAVDAFQNDVKVQYVKVAGKLTISGGRYYNLAVEGATAQGSLDNPLDAICPSDYDGKSLVIYGYTLYTASSNKYVNIITTAVEVVDSGDNEGGDDGEDDGSGDSGSIITDKYASLPCFLPTADDSTKKSYAHKANIEGKEYAILKLGTSSAAGTFTSTEVGVSGDKTLAFYAVAWKDKKGTLKISVDGTEVGTFELTSNVGAANNSPYTLTLADTDYYTVKLNGLKENSKVTFSTVSGAVRAIVCGINFTDGSGQGGNQGSGSTGDSDNQGSTSQTPVAGLISKAWAELPVCDQRDNVDYRYYISSVGSKSNVRNYTMCYDRTKKAALWIAYPLHSLYTSGDVGRTEDWAYEPSISSQYQAYLNKSYEGSYDRGHQIPSADRQSSREMNQQTFYFTNMTPQASSLNQSMWNNLETKVRNEICSDTLYVVTGAHFGGARHSSVAASTTDNNGQACPIPTHYYKALLRTVSGNTGKMISEIKDASQIQAIGIYVQHQNTTDSTIKNEYYISIKELESITGFNFFAMLDDSIESAVKAQCNPSAWF